jgi:hypothetical protein
MSHPGLDIDFLPWYRIEEFEDKMLSEVLAWFWNARKGLHSHLNVPTHVLICPVGF